MDVQPNYYCWLPLKRCTRQPLLISAQFHLISGSIPVSVLEERGRESNSDSDSDPFSRKEGSDQGPRVKTDWGRRCTTEQVQDEQGQPKSHGWSPGKTIREDFAAAAGKSLRRLPAQISTTRQDLDLEPPSGADPRTTPHLRVCHSPYAVFPSMCIGRCKKTHTT